MSIKNYDYFDYSEKRLISDINCIVRINKGIILSNLDLTTEEAQLEFEIYQKLKPYIGHCLTLNHDLNNPLAGILGYSEFLLEDDELNEEQKKFISQIMKSAERMQKLIENICEEKISLNEDINLADVVASYKKVEKVLD
ncbi:MAG: hypothetical protein DWP97_11970 [Calditrichaeota bacterium]|nr:MAG: hypothetical protein DWP97_11970 [Calditrichota bacterium]